MIFEAPHRRKALEQWKEERTEAEQELSDAVTRIMNGARRLTVALLAPILVWFDRS